ncbi:MAG: tail fiber domain-containing protein [Bacteroidetes bacterium]|nr:tail fiber domain-containing protein [Bacteroidota bacterium]
MKNLLLLTSILILGIKIGLTQIPGSFNYQAVVRDNTGELITNQNVDIQISIIDNSPTGATLYTEEHTKTVSSSGVVNLQIGDGTPTLGTFSNINWALNDKYLKTEIDLGNGYVNMGTTQLLAVPFSFYTTIADSAKVATNAYALRSNGVYSTSSDTLFVVKDHDGNVVFAVFPDGAQVIVNESTKGKVGGFAVSGRSPNKSVDLDIVRITPDSTRIYVNDTVSAKGKVGGFAVSGRSPNKNFGTDILYVTADSTRIFVNEDTGAKGKVGGFAVSGRSPNKGATTGYFQVTPDSTRIFVKDTVAGFGVASLDGASAQSLLNLNRQNYFIGHQTGNNTTIGKYNSMIGYQAGYTNTSGSNNIFFGYKAGYLNVTGGNNVFIGTESGYSNQYTFQSTYVGYRAGYEISGAGNTLLGSMAGESGGGGNNTFIGTSAGRLATGGNNTFVGHWAGYGFPDENQGVRNTYIGQSVGSKTTTGSYNVMLGFNAGYLNYEGSRNTFLGYDAGHNIHEGSGNVFIGHNAGYYADGINNRLIIDNENIDSTDVLLYGEFDQNHLRINGNVGINYQAYNSYGLIVDVPDGQSSIYTLLIYGDAWASGGSWNTSDVRYKKNIKTYANALNTIMQFRGVSYDWRVDEFPQQRFTEKRQLGFIAQEVEKVVPDLVKEGPDGFKGLEYAKFTPIIVEAIKEQQNQIKELKKENEDLQNRLERLEEMLTK